MAIGAATQTSEFKQRVSRLAVHRPFGGDGELTVELVRRQLALAALFEAGEGGFESLADFRDACDALWGVALDIDELREVVKALTMHGQVESKEGRYFLTGAARADLAATVEASKHTEATALAEWEASVRALAPELTGAEVAQLREDLLAWLQRIIVHYGAEAALILYPEEERAAGFFAEVEELGFGFLPKREEGLRALRAPALYRFIRNPTAAQRTHIANQMTTAYLMAVFTLDPDAQRLVEEITRGQRLYMDTNMLWSALNLNGPHAYLAAMRVLNMSRELGFELAVTPWTITEMKESVRRAREDLSKTALPPRALAEIAADAAGDTSFITAYWRKYKETGVTPDDFCDLHQHVEGLIEKLGIKLIAEGCTSVEQMRDAIGEQMSLLERFPRGEGKPERAKEHDVKHRLLIEKLRGTHERKFSTAGFWFLTRDGILIPYGLADRAPGALPFAVSLTAWTQIVRGCTPRTADYDQTLVDMLDTPSLRPRGVINAGTVAEVLGRIDLMVQDSTENVATRVMLDSAAMVEIETRSGEERTAQIDALVAEKNREMERQLQETQRELQKERTARAEAEKRIAAADATEQQRAAAEAAAAAEQAGREAVEREIAGLSEKVGTTEQEREQAKAAAADAEDRAAAAERLNSRHIGYARRALAVLIGALGVAIIAVPWAAEWVTGWALVGTIIAGGLVVAAGVWMGIHSKAARLLLAAAVALLGAGTAIHEIIAPAKNSPPPNSQKPHGG